MTPHLQPLLGTGRGEYGFAELQVGVARVERYPAGIAQPQRRGIQIAECAQTRQVNFILDARQKRADHQVEYIQRVVLGGGLEHARESHQRGRASRRGHPRDHGGPRGSSVARQRPDVSGRDAGQVELANRQCTHLSEPPGRLHQSRGRGTRGPRRKRSRGLTRSPAGTTRSWSSLARWSPSGPAASRCQRRSMARSRTNFDFAIAEQMAWFLAPGRGFDQLPPHPGCSRVGWRQLMQATPWGHKPRHLLHDRDAVYGRDFRQRAHRIGIDAIATPVRSPRANAVAERVIGTLRRECLDHMIVLDERHLASMLTEFVRYYNHERPHRTLSLQALEVTPRPLDGPIRSRPVLNGLHHVDERAT